MSINMPGRLVLQAAVYILRDGGYDEASEAVRSAIDTETYRDQSPKERPPSTPFLDNAVHRGWVWVSDYSGAQYRFNKGCWEVRVNEDEARWEQADDNRRFRITAIPGERFYPVARFI